VIVVEPRRFGDSRGWFMEVHHAHRYKEIGLPEKFVQDNLSHSVKGTLRGMHFQHPHAQAKLVQVLRGAVFDVAVDVRRGSPTFGKWAAVELTGDSPRQLFIPAGFAHGFCVLSDDADFFYKCTDLYTPECERTILWNDPDIGIKWPVENPLLSPKDLKGVRLRDADFLPTY
jgi:dTDP-4-dehydrorhamnose 3,5-epimerase